MSNRSIITRNMLLGDLGRDFPVASEVLAQEYGMHCATCGLRNTTETLEQGARLHGMSSDAIDELVLDLNERISE